MNFKIIHLMLWEIWAQNRLACLMFALVTPLLAVGFEFALRWFPEWQENQLMVHVNLSITGLIFAVIAFSYTECSSKDFKPGYPKHLFLLPLNTVSLVLLPMVSGVVITSLVAWLWINPILNLPFTPIEQVSILVAVSSIVIWVQLINWVLAHSPIQASVALLLVTVLICLAIGSSVPSITTDYALLNQKLALWILIALGVSGVISGLVFMSTHRYGRKKVRMENMTNFLQNLPGRKMSFTQAKSAQFWYEWNIFGWSLPVAALVLSSFMFVARDMQHVAITLMAYLGLAFTLGLTVATPYIGIKKFSLSPIVATKPLSDGLLAGSKLMTAFISCLLGALLLLVSLFISLIWGGLAEEFSGFWAEMTQKNSIGHGMMLMFYWSSVYLISVWLSCSLILTVCLSDNRKWILIFAFALTAMFVLFVVGTVLVKENQQLQAFASASALPIMGAIGISILVAMVLLFEKFKEVAKFKDLFGVLTLSGGYLVLMLVFFILMGIPRQAVLLNISMVFCLILLCVLPWVAGPIAVSYNRHR